MRFGPFLAQNPHKVWQVHEVLANAVSLTAAALRIVFVDHNASLQRRTRPTPMDADHASEENTAPIPSTDAEWQQTSDDALPRQTFPRASLAASRASLVDGTGDILEAVEAIADAIAHLVPARAKEVSASRMLATPGPILFRYCRDKGIRDPKKYARALQGHGITAAMLESGELSRAELGSIGLPLGVAAALIRRE
jgi:hypothetical protein